LCTFAHAKDAMRLRPAMILQGLRMMLGTRRMRRQAFIELVMPPALLAATDRDQLAAELAPLFGRDLAEQPPIILRQARAMARHDTFARLSELASIPTLVVSAALDRVALPQYGRELAQAIAGSRYVELPDAGHGVPIHSPALINDLLAEHFAAIESAPTP
jgi:3-oxoadipate enol-lactonase